MKANLIRRMAIAICLLSCICIYSCKKDNSASSQDITTSDLSATADDQAMVSNESDIITNDANTALNGQSDFSGSTSSSVSMSGNTAVNSVGVEGNTGVNSLLNVHQLICDATITYDTSNNQRVITIVYDGTNCWGNRTRSGKVIITLPLGQHWKDAGATANLVIDELKITRIRDNKSIVINGNKTFTNVSGGLLVNLASVQTITHTVSGTMSIDFDNGTTRAWNVSKQRVYTYDDGIVLTTTGTHSDGTNNDIAEWGLNRLGQSFQSLISAPKIFRQDCDFRLTSGQNTVITDKGTSVITYGLDENGNPTGCPGLGTYYYKLVWTGANGKTYTVILPY
jgi:hypothetical protein